MKHGPTSHTVYSKSGRHKPRALGMNDKGTQRNSSMGRDIKRGGAFRRRVR
jgi:hypothetical protein